MRSVDDSFPARASAQYTTATAANTTPTRISFDRGEEPMPANTPKAFSGLARCMKAPRKPAARTASGRAVQQSRRFAAVSSGAPATNA